LTDSILILGVSTERLQASKAQPKFVSIALSSLFHSMTLFRFKGLQRASNLSEVNEPSDSPAAT
jgi:hypothetical protein